jgi:hypothetical protein
MHLLGNVLSSLSFFRPSPSSSRPPFLLDTPPAPLRLPSLAGMFQMHLQSLGLMFLDADDPGNLGIAKITTARFRAGQNLFL